MIFKDTISVKDFQKLHEAVGWKMLTDKEIKLALKNSTLKVSAVEDDKVVGVARIISDGATHGLLSDVIVSPEYQGRGIGTAMIKYLMQKCQEFANNHDEFMVELLPTAGNTDFYVKCGFKHAPDSMDGCYKWFKNQNVYCDGSKKYVYHLHKKPFASIKSGRKTIEMRLFDEKRQKLKVGDILIFVNRETEKKIRTKIEKLTTFKNFEELYSAYDKTLLGYNKKEIARPEDMRKYYSQEDEKKFGVLAIELKLIKD